MLSRNCVRAELSATEPTQHFLATFYLYLLLPVAEVWESNPPRRLSATRTGLKPARTTSPLRSLASHTNKRVAAAQAMWLDER